MNLDVYLIEKIENNEVDGNVNRLVYDCLSQTLPPLRKSIFNETLSNKEIYIFLQIFKYFNQDIMHNDQLRCFTFFQVVMKSYRDRGSSYKKHAILIAQKVSDKTYKKMSLFMLITLITSKIWYNYCSSINGNPSFDEFFLFSIRIRRPWCVAGNFTRSGEEE